MDMFGTLIALVLAIPVLAVVAIVMAVGTRDRLKRLEGRLTRLELWLAEREGDLPAQAPSPGAGPATTPKLPDQTPADALPAPPEPQAAAPAPPSAPTMSKPKISLEERFGTQWVVWAGGIALALGGFFLSAKRSSKAGSARSFRSCSAPRWRSP
jgi:hypothetical protein